MRYQVSPSGRHDKALVIQELFGFLAALEILNARWVYSYWGCAKRVFNFIVHQFNRFSGGRVYRDDLPTNLGAALAAKAFCQVYALYLRKLRGIQGCRR
jgi:hypothetical protein